MFDTLETFIRDRALTYLKKNKDYGDSFNESLDKYGIVAYKVRAEDKVKRIENLIKRENEVKDESIKDTVYDLFNYSVMAYCWETGTTGILSIIDVMWDFANNDFRVFVNYIFEKGVTDSNTTVKIGDLLKRFIE